MPLKERRAGKRTLPSFPVPPFAPKEWASHHADVSKLAVLFAGKIAKKYRFPKRDIEGLAVAGRTHDIGKADERVARALAGNAKAGNNKKATIKKHVNAMNAELGEFWKFEKGIKREDVGEVLRTITYHQEKWDGSGYPDSLRGIQIPYKSRILAIVDAYCAMTEDRGYSRRKSPLEALAIIEHEAGKSFDPEITKDFVKYMREKGTAEFGRIRTQKPKKQK